VKPTAGFTFNEVNSLAYTQISIQRRGFVAPVDRQPLSLLDNLVCLLNLDIILPRLRRLTRPKTLGWTLF
jgi:hypothetical protein